MTQSSVLIRALSPKLLLDFLKVFDGTAISDNPKWASCYCQRFYEDHSVVKWSERTAPQNRALACERIQARSMQGYVAYVDDAPVGWCTAARRHLQRALDDAPTPDAEQVGAFFCFLVEPIHSSRVVARQWLEAACDGLSAQESWGTTTPAPPSRSFRGSTTWPASTRRGRWWVSKTLPV